MVFIECCDLNQNKMTDKQKTLQIEIHLIIDKLQNGLIHPMIAKKLLYESANKSKLNQKEDE